MKTFLFLGLVLLNSVFAAEIEKGSCLVKINGIEHQYRMYMWEDEEVFAPIMITVQNGMGEPRKLRIIYDYTYATHEMNIKFVDCNHLYQPPGTTMNVCSHLFSSKQTAMLKVPFEIVFGGQLSSEPEIKVSCLRTRE